MEDLYVEIIGSVKEDLTVKALTSINLGKQLGQSWPRTDGPEDAETNRYEGGGPGCSAVAFVKECRCVVIDAEPTVGKHGMVTVTISVAAAMKGATNRCVYGGPGSDYV
jgi:hypothetical protein